MARFMCRDEQAAVQVMMGDDIVPALAKVQLDIACGWPLNERVDIMPGIGCLALIVNAQGRGERVGGGIPAVELAADLNQQVNATDEGGIAVDDRAFLVQ